MKKISLLIFFALIFTACNSDKQENVYEVDTSIHAPIEEFIKREVACVELETTPQSMIGRIQDLEFDKDDIVINPSPNAETLLRFNRYTGEFINTIGHNGRGPIEWDHIRSMVLHEKEIYILTTHKILVYSIDGEFQRRIDTPKEIFFNLTICDDGKIWLASSSCNKSQYEFHLLNPTTGEIEAKMGEFSENVGFAISSNLPVIKWGENEYLATRQWDQTIYRLTSNSYEPYMTIDFNLPNTIPAQQRQSLTRANVMDKVMNVDNYFDYYVNIIQNKDIITAVARLDYNLSDDCMVKINTKTAKTKFLHLTGCKSEQFPYLSKCKFYRNIVDNVVVGRANAHDINQTERFKHLKDDDNPVLFFYELNLE